jgi:hypothetical protein
MYKNANSINRRRGACSEIPGSSGRRINRSREQVYWQRAAKRFSLGLLSPFPCALCGVISVDPLGRNTKHEWLCGGCADPEIPPEFAEVEL